jgi:hypothetical protein
MLPGNLCERCNEKVQPAKARHRQTKYCLECAKIKKRENTLDPWTPDKRRNYMRDYMRGYRARFSCLLLFLPFLGTGGLSLESLNSSFDQIATGIEHAELLVIKVASLAAVVAISIRHLKHAWMEKKDEDEKKKKRRLPIPIADTHACYIVRPTSRPRPVWCSRSTRSLASRPLHFRPYSRFSRSVNFRDRAHAFC